MYTCLKNHVVIITGAGGGIGRTCAQRLSHEGCRLVLNDIDPETLEATVSTLDRPSEAVTFPGDIGDSRTANSLVECAIDAYGEVNALINNAARVHWGPVAQTSDDEWDSVLRVTLNGAFYGVRAALKAMSKNAGPERGAIVNIASGAALGGEEGLGAYGAAKAAMVNLTRTTAVENAKDGIRCNVILPGPIATPPMLAAAEQSPGGLTAWESHIVPRRLGQPEEIANAICFLISSESSYINGATICVDGGVSARTNSPQF